MLAGQLSDAGCMEFLGCKGKKTYSDCPLRKWNAGSAGQYGVNWCIGARSPCLGCVEPSFPDGMSPFYVYSPTTDKSGERGRRAEPPISWRKTRRLRRRRRSADEGRCARGGIDADDDHH